MPDQQCSTSRPARMPIQYYLLAACLLAAPAKAADPASPLPCEWLPEGTADDRHEGYSFDFKLRPNYRAIASADVAPAVASWEAHVAQLPCCVPGAPLHGRFYMDSSRHYAYEPDSCRLCRLTGSAARSCLAGQDIMFIGDSITRYHYLSLAHFLSRLKYPERYGAAPGQPSVCLEREWPNWGSFYEQSSQVLGMAVSACAQEACNCSRGELRCRDDSWDEAFLRSMKEDRALRITSRVGENLALSYRQAFPLPDYVKACVQPLQELRALAEAKQAVPSVVVMNVGHWWYSLPLNELERRLGEILLAGVCPGISLRAWEKPLQTSSLMSPGYFQAACHAAAGTAA